MNAQQLEKQLNNLKPAEKLQLIQTLAQNLSDNFLPKETSEPNSISVMFLLVRKCNILYPVIINYLKNQ